MSEQIGFLFDSVLEEVPRSSVVAAPVQPARLSPRELLSLSDSQLIALCATYAETLQDGFTTSDVLTGVGFPLHSIVASHRARVLDAVVGATGNFTAYLDANTVRFFRRTKNSITFTQVVKRDTLAGNG